jgi:hypothetical protein
MASRLFVVNEWLLDDLLGTNGPGKRKESFEWLERMHARCDRIAVLESSPWAQKAFRLMKQTDATARGVSKFLHLNVLQNQLKSRFVALGDLKPAPDDVRAATPDSDKYLVDLYHTVDAAKLITTDTVVHSNLAALRKVKVQMRDPFIQAYMAGTDTD